MKSKILPRATSFGFKTKRDNTVPATLIERGFDQAFYEQQADQAFPSAEAAALHYDAFGWQQGYDPCAAFSTTAYIDEHSDVREAHVNPFLHYALHGESEARACRCSIHRMVTAPNPSAQSEPQPTSVDLPYHYDPKLAEAATLIERGFDRAFYERQADQAFPSAEAAALHYNAFGWQQGYDPCAAFSTTAYLDEHSDVREAHVNPFLHYA
ncbi:MAG: hypothetical protein V4533_04885, partial [Pseudomonadota bacterium]